jgi:F-type H+-transporting ATPase subunit epsilon
MAKLKISVISQDKIAYQGEADAVFAPTQSGIIEVLPEHMQLVSALKKGEITVKNGSETKNFKANSGVIEVRKNSNVIILADIEKE